MAQKAPELHCCTSHRLCVLGVTPYKKEQVTSLGAIRVQRRPNYLFLGLYFFHLSAKFCTVLLEIIVGLLAHTNRRSVIAFHLRFIRFITNKSFGVTTTNGGQSYWRQ